MAVIKSKKTAVIQKGTGYAYLPDSFKKEHAITDFVEVDDPLEMLSLIKPFERNGRKFITFDTETHPHFSNSQVVPASVIRRWVGKGKVAVPQDYPFCLSICDGKNAFSMYDSVDNGFEKFKHLAPLFEDPSIEKIAHNAKFDMHMFANAGMKIVGRLHDTIILAKLANENRRSFQLRDLASTKSGGVIKFEYMVDTYKQLNKVRDYRNIPRELLTQYANADVWNAFIVFMDEYTTIELDNLVDLYDRECELMIALYAMERYGIAIDPSYEEPLKEELQNLTDSAEALIYEEAGKMFNINSGKQLYEVLISLGVKDEWVSRTDKGNPSLDKNALGVLADRYNVSIVKNILEFRKYERFLNTYAVGIYDQMDSEYRVHCNINQTEATTGRMSITKPALQTLPKKDKRIRRAFMPDEGYELYFSDLDQVEYRLFAHYAKIPSLIDAIMSGHDVHAATAAMLYHIDLNEFILRLTEGDTVANDLRSKGKTINFALIYGVGIEHLSDMLKCTVTEATNTKVNYFSQLPEAKIFIATVYQVIKERGFVKNFYGRRRRLGPNDCYKAPNSLIQGCAADYLKEKLVAMFKYIMHNDLKTRLLLPVHDEVVIMAHKDELHHVAVLRTLLSDFTSFRCPITAGIEVGTPSWGQKVPANDFDFVDIKDRAFLNYNVYDGKVFDIHKEEQI